MSTRVRSEHLEQVLATLRDWGLDPKVGPVTNFRLNGGCNDPSCCPQHPARESPQDWVEFHNVSGNQVAKALLAIKKGSREWRTR